MDRLWKTDGDYCMLVLRLAAGLQFLIQGASVALSIRAGGPLLSLARCALEILAAVGVLGGILARLSAGALMLLLMASIIAFGGLPPGLGFPFCTVAGALLWTIVVHGAGPWSVDHWLMRHVVVKRV